MLFTMRKRRNKDEGEREEKNDVVLIFIHKIYCIFYIYFIYFIVSKMLLLTHRILSR